MSSARSQQDFEAYFQETQTPVDQADVQTRQQHNVALRSAIRATLADRNNRNEAVTWAVETVARLPLPNVAARQHMFCGPLGGEHSRYDPSSETFCLQLLRMFCEQQPAQATALLWQINPQAVKEYFQGSERRIVQWFNHFSPSGASQLGAAALANFALNNRADMWHLLVWSSKHPHAPVAVSAQPQYLCELDVVATVERLSRDCPQFWTSQELRNSLHRGELIRNDTAHFAEELQRLVIDADGGSGLGSTSDNRSSRTHGAYRSKRDDKPRSSSSSSSSSRASGRGHSDKAASSVRAAVADFVASGDYPALCRRLLHLLPQAQLLAVLNTAAKHTSRTAHDSGSRWIAAEIAAARLVFAETGWTQLDDLLLANAMAFKVIELWQRLGEDEQQMEVARHALDRMQQPSLLSALWQHLKEGAKAGSPSDTRATVLLAEKFAAHIHMHEQAAASSQVGRLLQLARLRYQQVDRQPQYELLSEPPSKSKSKHKKLKQKSSKHGVKKRRHESPDVVKFDAAPSEAVGNTWEIELDGQKELRVCDARQVHAVVAMRLLERWLHVL